MSYNLLQTRNLNHTIHVVQVCEWLFCSLHSKVFIGGLSYSTTDGNFNFVFSE